MLLVLPLPKYDEKVFPQVSLRMRSFLTSNIPPCDDVSPRSLLSTKVRHSKLATCASIATDNPAKVQSLSVSDLSNKVPLPFSHP